MDESVVFNIFLEIGKNLFAVLGVFGQHMFMMTGLGRVVNGLERCCSLFVAPSVNDSLCEREKVPSLTAKISAKYGRDPAWAGLYTPF